MTFQVLSFLGLTYCEIHSGVAIFGGGVLSASIFHML